MNLDISTCWVCGGRVGAVLKQHTKLGVTVRLRL